MLSHEEAGRALRRLDEESDRMADALVAMDTHAGHQLLRNAALKGLTKRRWTETSATMTVLWEQFNLHRRMVELAKDLLARRDIGALTTVLTDPVVELNAQQLPIEQRSLTGPAIVSERVTMTELVERMKAAYKAITEVLAAADTAWTTTIGQIDPLETQLRTVSALATSLGVDDPALAGIARDLGHIRELALADPMALDAGQSTQWWDRLAGDLEDVRSRLHRLSSAKDTFDDRMARIEALLGEVGGACDEAEVAYATVMQKIASPGLARPNDSTGPLRARLTELPHLWRAGQWRELAAGLEALERDSTSALAEARTQLRLVTGLLDRRLELRGRLEAYRAKASRLGHAEDLDLTELHRTAHGVLYTTPCDLPAATRAVNRYQQALQEKRTAS
ncbi:hypothetical protein [Kibdelosporangium phytohabitans]|uniref:Uncharacterized protein n=1 Tax=Kibdelosporangium phytohabitans TaxID=860235 RepID=A0A0N9I166_9PSEU|nr:hypothetical protein [Kibdelosporangium phytohabitans]ALG07933.1 hypothetical protein AOZ06_14310 [Kibdelosporangium phytohabitans]MBE1471127.1 hypothetical protein [Kibdelosporangium phytohabitans]